MPPLAEAPIRSRLIAAERPNCLLRIWAHQVFVARYENSLEVCPRFSLTALMRLIVFTRATTRAVDVTALYSEPHEAAYSGREERHETTQSER